MDLSQSWVGGQHGSHMRSSSDSNRFSSYQTDTDSIDGGNRNRLQPYFTKKDSSPSSNAAAAGVATTTATAGCYTNNKKQYHSKETLFAGDENYLKKITDPSSKSLSDTNVTILIDSTPSRSLSQPINMTTTTTTTTQVSQL